MKKYKLIIGLGILASYLVCFGIIVEQRKEINKLIVLSVADSYYIKGLRIQLDVE